MPWEETEDYFRSGHRDPSTCQEGSQWTITISEEQGIEAVVCRPHGSDSTVVQSYLFSKEKGWTLSKAKEWFRQHHQGSLAGMSLQYVVKAEAVREDGKLFTLIEVIDESKCENNWRINPAGKPRALESLMTTPLLGPPELGHDAIDVVGRPYDFESNYTTRVLYGIPRIEDWQRIDSGEWKFVSPHLTFLKSHYDEDGTLVIDEWRWDHTAFVENPAFPNIGVKSTCTDDPRLCSFSKAMTAALIDSHGWRPQDGREPRQDVGTYSRKQARPREKTRGPPGGVTMEKDNECEKVIAELTDAKTNLEAELKDVKAKAAELTETNKNLNTEVKQLKEAKAKAQTPPPSPSEEMAAVQAELKAIKAENDALKAWKLGQEDADHMRRVQGVIDRRVKAGLLDPKQVQAAFEPLKKLPNDALDAMSADLDAVQGKFESLPSGPKARLIPSVTGARFDPMQPTVGDRVGKKPGEV